MPPDIHLHATNQPPFTFIPSLSHDLLETKELLAEADATSALQIDPLHYKSYQRRCVARLSLGKCERQLWTYVLHWTPQLLMIRRGNQR